VRNLIRDEIKSHVDQVRVDGMGNLIALKRGSGSGPRRKLMVAAHMDEVGLIVTHVDRNGFLRFSPLGALEIQGLLGQRCLFANGTVGVIGREEKGANGHALETERLYIDVAASGTANLTVGVGDAAAPWASFADAGNHLIGKAFDDRVGCAVLIEALNGLHKCPNDVYFVFTVQQLVGARGAITSTFGIQPDFAIAVDVTQAGDTPEAKPVAVSLGRGPAIKVKDAGILVSPVVRDVLIQAARDAGVAYQFEVTGGGSSDAGAMQVTREGGWAGAVSVPLRYLHTPSEVVDLDDVEAAVKLLRALMSKPLNVASQ
ncbi:MAG: M42 family metallopeptidase, partial [Rudaea sp.]